MRSILTATLLCFAAAATAEAEEPYLLTGKAYGACIGTQMRFKYDPPQMIREVIQQKCGKLEEQETEQFADFIVAHVGQTLTAELAAIITVHMIASPQKLREGAIEAYLKTFAKPADRPPPAPRKYSSPPVDITPQSK
ncbi:hypothetical protein [Bradyrhizobium sp. BR 1433]|uniref:hypothetical protein n=1 Tax=Bradyrhizobium sp. BR 1433 TaxID=3447967 RepID=UPI003EE56737